LKILNPFPLIPRRHLHCRPQTFFQGRAKFCRGGGQKHTICLKDTKIFTKTSLLFPWKSRPSQRGARAPSCPPLRTPMVIYECSFTVHNIFNCATASIVELKKICVFGQLCDIESRRFEILEYESPLRVALQHVQCSSFFVRPYQTNNKDIITKARTNSNFPCSFKLNPISKLCVEKTL